jgi:transposase
MGLEAGELSSWIAEGLRAQGYMAVCLEAYHARAALKAQRNKTDKNDARGLAQLVRSGWYKEAMVRNAAHRRYRLLLNALQILMAKKQDINNGIRACLKSFGVKLGQVGTQGFAERVIEAIEGDDELTGYIVPLMAVRAALLEQIPVLHARLLSVVKADTVCRMWMEIPGVGPVTALAFKVAVDDPGKFKRSRQVGAFLGLTPRKHASGTVERDGHISKQGDSLTRGYLFEAAQVLMTTRTKKRFALKSWGLKLAKRSTLKNAITAVARRLAVIMHAMWRDGTCFDQPVVSYAKR